MKLLTLATSLRSPSETSTGNGRSGSPQIVGSPATQPGPANSGAEYSKNAMRTSRGPSSVPRISTALTSPAPAS